MPIQSAHFFFSTGALTVLLFCQQPSWRVRGDTFWFRWAFPWWLMMLSIFSQSCWPVVCLLWKTCRFFARFLIRGFILLLLSVWVPYVFWVLTPHLTRYVVCKYFVWIYSLPFHFLDCLLCRSLVIWGKPACLFLLYVPELLEPYPNISLPRPMPRSFPLCFLSGVLCFQILCLHL